MEHPALHTDIFRDITESLISSGAFNEVRWANDGRTVIYKDRNGLTKQEDFNEDGQLLFRYQCSPGNREEYSRFSNGKVIYTKTFSGPAWWVIREYDAQGNEIHFSREGWEEWRDYDERGNNSHYRCSAGLEWWSDHDAQGNTIHFRRNTDGMEWWKEYDERNREIHYRDARREWWCQYDEEGLHYRYAAA